MRRFYRVLSKSHFPDKIVWWPLVCFQPLTMTDDIQSGSSQSTRKCIRWLTHPTAFATLYGIVGVVQGMLFTYFIGIITTLEKRFAYGSKVTGIITLADNLSPALLSVVIAYFASRGHRPRWCAVSIMISGLSALLFASPYFIFGDGRKYLEASSLNSTATYQLCGQNEESCVHETSGRGGQTIIVVCIFFVANFFAGIGSIGYYVIGTSLIDDSTHNARTPLYFGVLYSIRMIGPTAGFLLSSQFLQYYEDPSVRPSYDDRDPRWVGAWWIGFVVVGLVLLIIGSLMMPFPKTIIKKMHRRLPDGGIKKNVLDRFKEIPVILRLLLRNPLLIFYNLGIVSQFLSNFGYFAFLPKYLENVFHLSPSESNRILGLGGILVMVLGFLLGGLVLYVFKPRPRYVMAWMASTIFISAIMLLAMAFIGCEQEPPIVTSGLCVDDCRCDLSVFTPVCDRTKKMSYFSPCHAGCSKNSFENSSAQVLDGCSCLSSAASRVTLGACGSKCQKLTAFVVVLIFMKFLSASGQIGAFIVMLRSVPVEEKTLAISINTTLLSAFAFLPYPLVYGALVDSTCYVWETKCGRLGHCWLYDTDKFRVRLHGVSSGMFFVASFFYAIVWYLSKSVENMYVDDVQEEQVIMSPTTTVDKESNVAVNDAFRMDEDLPVAVNDAFRMDEDLPNVAH